MYFETPAQRISLSINTAMPYTHIGDKYFIKEKSTSILLVDKVEKTIKTKTYQDVNYVRDIVVIDKENIDNLDFYIFFPENQSWSDGFGFSFRFEDPNFSIIDKLFNEKHIQNKMFALVPYANQNNTMGKVYIGGLPDSINEKEYRYSTQCKVEENYIPWGCRMKKLNYYNRQKNATYSYTLNSYAVISSNQYWMIYSFKFFHYVIEKVFKANHKLNFCKYKKAFNDISVVCNKKALEDLGDFDLEFDQGQKMRMQLKDLFRCPNELQCFSMFASNEEDKNAFELGGKFLRLFNITNFF